MAQVKSYRSILGDDVHVPPIHFWMTCHGQGHGIPASGIPVEIPVNGNRQITKPTCSPQEYLGRPYLYDLL